MAKKISKSKSLETMNEFFSKINSKSSKEIEQIKRLVMGQNIKLGPKRKLFCKKCLNPYKISKVRIKNNIKTITCENCGKVSKWKINSN